VGEEFSERGPNFLNYVQHIFQGEKEILGGLIREVFDVVSREKHITKQMLLVLCGYFFWKVIIFENLRKVLESSSLT